MARWTNLTVQDEPRYDANVAKLQKAINRHNRYLKIGGVTVDGKFGITTLVKARRVAWFLGAPDLQLKRGEPLRPWTQMLVRAPWRIYARNRAAAKRGARRIRDRRRYLRNWRTMSLRELARYAAESPNVKFWTNSTGNERNRFEEIVRHGRARVPIKGTWAVPDIDLLRFIVDVAQRGKTIHVNALTGGKHSFNSRHYIGKGLDTDLSYGGSEEEQIASEHGLVRNWERTHRHYDA